MPLSPKPSAAPRIRSALKLYRVTSIITGTFLLLMVAYPFISLLYYSSLAFSVLRPMQPAKSMGFRNYELLLYSAGVAALIGAPIVLPIKKVQ